MQEIDVISSHFEKLQQSTDSLLDGLSVDQWRWSVSPQEWSVSQCLSHINTVNGLVVPRLEDAVRRGIAEQRFSPGPFRYPVFDRLFVFALEPRAPLEQRAPEIYQPAAIPSPKEILEIFHDLQHRLIDAARSSAGLDLVRIKIASPVSARLRFSLGTWFAAVGAHEENHLRQAERVLQSPQFPK
jgi:hypothetical protein